MSSGLAQPHLPAATAGPLLFTTGIKAASRPLNVVCIGAHPDDPETGCGGTLAKLADQGHHVTILYLTRGEAGIKDGERHSTGVRRSAEARNACGQLRAEAAFGGQIDGETAADPERCEAFTRLLLSLEPDVVFTHWPIDTHHDHRTAATLAYQAWQAAGEGFTLVYYEVMTGIQTHHFFPNYYVDIGQFSEVKRSAIYEHASQRPDRFYGYHEDLERQRGLEAGKARAEAFMVVREKWPKPLRPFSI